MSGEFLNKCFKKNNQIVTRDIAEEVILVPVRQRLSDLNCLYVLENKVSKRIWQLIDGKTALKDIVKKIVGEFEAEEAKVTSDLTDFVQTLLKADILKTAKN